MPFFRSPVAAWGDSRRSHVADAAEADGVHAVLTIKDLEAAGMDISMAATVLQSAMARGASRCAHMLLPRTVCVSLGNCCVVIAETMNQAA